MAIGDYLKRLLKNLSQPASQAELDRKAQLEKQTRLAAAKAQAAIVDKFIDDVNSPATLAEMEEFQAGVTLLHASGFSGKELLELSEDPSQALWQMGLMAVSLRDVDPALVAPMLTMFEEGGPWHKYFVMKALLVHTPIERSLAGELLFRLKEYSGPWLDNMIKITIPVLTHRMEDGEKPSFGELLEKLDAEKAENMETVLTAALDSPLKEVAESLQTELGQWRAVFTDLKVLQTIGRIWDTNAKTGPW